MRKASGGIRRRWRLRDIWFAIGAILLVLWIMFITVSTVTMFALDRQSRESMQGVLDFGSSKLESRLRQIENFLTVTLVSDDKFGMLRNTSLSYADNLRQVARQMDSYGQYFPDFSGIFFYEPSRDILINKQWNDISAYSMTYVTRRMEIRTRMKTLCIGEEQERAIGEWTIENIDNKWTAFYIYYHQGQYLGVYVSLDGIWNRIIDLEGVAGFEESGLTDRDGYELTGDKERTFGLESSSYWEEGRRYLQLTEKIDGFPAAIVTLVQAAAAGKLDDMVDRTYCSGCFKRFVFGLSASDTAESSFRTAFRIKPTDENLFRRKSGYSYNKTCRLSGGTGAFGHF